MELQGMPGNASPHISYGFIWTLPIISRKCHHERSVFDLADISEQVTDLYNSERLK